MPSSSLLITGPLPATGPRLAGPSEVPAFPVVGIGASAGWLEALQLFLKGVPRDCGMAFVVVQHRDPSHDGVLVEILQRATPMPVRQATDHLPLQPDHVYVIPPDRDLSLLQGELLLIEPVAPHGLRLPIDFFFRALASDMRERSIGVILSGMGSDGTLGLRAIREASGSVFVQDPLTAAFDSMPRSAILAGLADVVASPQELAARVLAYRNYEPWRASLPGPGVGGDEAQLDKVIAILRTQTGQDFSLYKKSTIYRRVERRMALHQLPRLADYPRFLRQNKDEASLLFKELLIGVTRFFRDPEVWEQLKAECIPALLAANPAGGTLRAWTPACSTGEEAYTLAMVFQEALYHFSPDVHYALQIFATDLDADAIQVARAGIYPANISADVSEARLQRFFVQEDGVFRVSRDLRGMVVFSQQNVVMDPPFTNIDLLSCRNLLIYLESDLQRKLLPLFHYSLRTNGYLILGNSETANRPSSLFAPLSGSTRIYKRRNVVTTYDPVEFPPVFSRPRAGVAALEADAPLPRTKLPELLLQDFAPSAVLTSSQGEILYLCGKASQYLAPAAGKASMSVFAMARGGLSAALNEIFAKAVREQQAVELAAVRVADGDDARRVNLRVQPLGKPQALAGMVLVVFSECTTEAAASAPSAQPQDTRLLGLSAELQHVRDELRATRDEMQASQEELKASNEELQSTNEELQSANEELTTSREEMQSMNEELESVNRELTSRVADMSQASDDMKNLLNSTAIATLFLDDQMRVRRFTTQARSIFKLIASDVGRPITDLVNSLHYPQLATDAQEVLRTLVFHEVRVQGDANSWYQVRTMPYRTQDNRIDGVVITLVDVTAQKALEQAARQALAALQAPGQGAGQVPQAVLQQALVVLQTALVPLPSHGALAV